MSNEGVPDPFSGLVDMVDVGHRYADAPIIEATVDLRVSLPAEFGIDELSGLYPDLDLPQPFFEFIPRVEENRIVASNDRQAGFRYLSKNQFAITASLDRFAFSQLSKYRNWEDFLGKADSRWQRFKDVTRPIAITNVGVRYVNRIVVHKKPIDINDYLRTTVNISPYLPQAINQYFAQISFPITDYGVEGTVATALVEPPVPDATALVLDIDVSHKVEIDPASESFNDVLTHELGILRKAKNYVFEACITDATRGVIDSGADEGASTA